MNDSLLGEDRVELSASSQFDRDLADWDFLWRPRPGLSDVILGRCVRIFRPS